MVLDVSNNCVIETTTNENYIPSVYTLGTNMPTLSHGGSAYPCGYHVFIDSFSAGGTGKFKV